ncbi:MAG: hypothetical protein ABR915_10960 [Thermoguttaceae bacterium]
MKKKHWIGVPTICLLLAIGGVTAFIYRAELIAAAIRACDRSPNADSASPVAFRPAPLAPNAEEAPKVQTGTGGNAASLPKCQWPDNFSLDVNIKLAPPEVPEKIQGSTPGEER